MLGAFTFMKYFKKKGFSLSLGVENFGMERIEQHKMVSLGKKRVKLEVFVLFSCITMKQTACLKVGRKIGEVTIEVK